MTRAEAERRLARLHEAQSAFYAGRAGSEGPLRALLSPAVRWHVPGASPIAGDHAGVDAVMAYFARRRDLAAATFRLHPAEVLVGDGDHVAVLTDGTADVGGVEHRWSTVGLYRFEGDLVAEGRLLPFDAAAFDAIWSGRPAAG